MLEEAVTEARHRNELRDLDPPKNPGDLYYQRQALAVARAIGSGVMTPNPDITRLLNEQAEGREGAFDELVEVVFEELCRIARRQMRSQKPGHTLNTGSLVNEAYLHLSSLADAGWKNRGHFFGVAGLAMKQILLQHARAKMAKKRGSGSEAVPLEDALLMTEAQAESLIAVDEALGRLEQQGPRLRQVVEHKIFSGLTVDEIAEAVGASKATVKRDWMFARAWLNRELGAGGTSLPGD